MSSTQRFWRARTTVQQMLRDRGYGNIRKYADQNALHQMLSKKDLTPFMEHSRITATTPDGSPVTVLFSLIPKTGVDIVRTIRERTGHLILVIISMTAFAKRSILQDAQIELFYVRDLQYNVTHHKYVPPHRALKKDEEMTFLKQFKRSDLPLLLTTDPVSRYYHFQPDQIIRIDVPGHEGHASVRYRRVVSA